MEAQLQFKDKTELVKALSDLKEEPIYIGLKRLRQQLNVRPNSSDPVESALATKSLAVVYAYVEEFPECTQLLKIWEWQHEHDVKRIEASIVEVLSKLIHQCNTALHRTFAIKLTRAILQNQSRMTCIYKNLSSGRQNTVQATLRLLTAMNHVHHTTTKELKDGFNFGLKALSKLKYQRRKEGDAESAGKADTRTLYIQFLLAFFIRGDATVKKEVLEMPDLFQVALKDLQNDTFPLIKQVLNVFINNIITDNDLSRTTKISFFNTNFLVNQLKLYTRTEAVPNSDQTVAQLVHEFMMALCTKPGVGICFQDAAWYPPSTLAATATVEKAANENNKHIFNKTLSQLLTHLRPTENIMQQQLTVSILTACPELVRLYWQKANLQMEPRLSARWLANMTLLHKITEIPVPNLYLQHTGLFASHPPPVSTIIENILPTAANRTVLSKGLQHSSMLVRYFTIVELAAAFQKTEQVIAVMQSAVRTLANDEEEAVAADNTMEMDGTGISSQSLDPPAQQWAGAITLLLAELRRRVPDIQIIISLHNGIQIMAQTDIEDEERIRRNLINNGVLRLIKYYQQFLPQAVIESKFDIGKLIPSDFATVQAGTLIHLLELLLELNDFRWSNKSLDGSSSHLSKLLSLYLTTAHAHIKALTRRLIAKLLGESILFQHDPSEANLWIEAIPTTNYGQSHLTQDQISFLQFFDDCVARCLRTPYKYVDQSGVILKAVQDPVAMATHHDRDGSIAHSVAVSQHQNFSQQYSPLLMTMLEQFHHVYAKDTSKDTALSISAFLQSLLPTLTWNQNRTSVFATECLRRIQEPTKEDIQSVLDLSTGKRALITKLGVSEHLAMTLESLEGPVVVRLSDDKLFKKTDNSQQVQLLKSGDPSEFITLLKHQSAASIAKCFGSTVEYSSRSIQATECLVDYVSTRFPFAGSIFGIPDVELLLEQDGRREGSEHDAVYIFLQRLSFPTLFNNTNPSTVSNTTVRNLLKDAIARTEFRHIVLYANLIVLQLSNWIKSGSANEDSVGTCFALLTDLLERSRSEETVFIDLKARLWESFVLRELYLHQDKSSKTRVKYLDALDSHLVDLLVSSTKSKSPASNNKAAAADLILTSTFIRRTVECVMHELERVKKVGLDALHAKVMCTRKNSDQITGNVLIGDESLLIVYLANLVSLHEQTIRYFSRLAFMCPSSDLTALLQTLLSLHRQAEFSTTSTFNALLSTILKHLTQQGGSASAIPVQSTAALLDLWRKQPSDDLDAIVLDVILGRLWPNAMAKSIHPVDLSVASVFDQALNSLHNASLEHLDLSLVDFILDHPNSRRSLILAALMTASPVFCHRFTKVVLLTPKAKLGQHVGNPGFCTLLHAYLNRLSTQVDGCYRWSKSASDQDRQSATSLRPLLLSSLVQRIARSSSSSSDTVIMAECAAILIALTVRAEDEDEVTSAWALVGSISRIGLDSITIVEALLAVTKELPEEQSLERQRRIARWFEETSRHLNVVLDKNGDAEWLEPVCDRLFHLLEAYVMERQLGIDQKVLFELVSFAIEKALDNVEVVRFSASLAKYYYVETAQSSVLPQILQTLFKHKQFSSLVMATAPTTKHTVPENVKSRLAIIQLIYTLTSLEPATCCKAGFLPMLLACYSASTSVADQLVLAVLRITELQTAGSISNRAPIWGPGAENTKTSSALFGQAMINESLDRIDPNVMMISLIHFPLDHELESVPPTVTLQDYDEEVLKLRQAPVYDPCFFLPLFGTYMAFGNQLDCRRMIEVNGLGMVIVALSSNDESMRLAAFSLLDDFYTILSNASLREKNQLLLLLDALKNSIVDREDGMAPRLPAAITTFVAHALATLLKPDHFMYPHINKFCLQRPTIDLEDIPMFYSMFNSSSDQHRKERVWMLRLLAASLKTAEDYRLFKRRHVVDLLTAFFNSQLSEPLSRKIVIEILFNATAIPKVSLQLMTQSAFLSWLHTLAAINIMSNENEFSLVPARLVLRAVQTCPQENIRWMNGIWRNQVAGIATTLLRQLSIAKVTSINLAWALMSLESILQIFAFLDFDRKKHLTALDGVGALDTAVLSASHVGMILQLLQICEQTMVVSPEQCPIMVPSMPSFEAEDQLPKRSDSLDLLYRINPTPVQSHGRVVRLCFELMMADQKQQSSLTAEQRDLVLSRALCYRIEDAIETARLCETSGPQ
ncbi:hypothetical protein KVV02_006084 [Mortierella alpina]|uniref:Uncharacterized protein n=1 Tax=Mortierella alpina TaxID=64518 RepID=A0A9P8D1M8_MORAP|nr:hypothetical protein KVV02_006084 [Mortierella alpina]